MAKEVPKNAEMYRLLPKSLIVERTLNLICARDTGADKINLVIICK